MRQPPQGQSGGAWGFSTIPALHCARADAQGAGDFCGVGVADLAQKLTPRSGFFGKSIQHVFAIGWALQQLNVNRPNVRAAALSNVST